MTRTAPLLLAASLLLVLAHAAPAAQADCYGAHTSTACTGVTLEARLTFLCIVGQLSDCLYVCGGIYTYASEHCTGLQLP